jgi:hypothetical protein
LAENYIDVTGTALTDGKLKINVNDKEYLIFDIAFKSKSSRTYTNIMTVHVYGQYGNKLFNNSSILKGHVYNVVGEIRTFQGHHPKKPYIRESFIKADKILFLSGYTKDVKTKRTDKEDEVATDYMPKELNEKEID